MQPLNKPKIRPNKHIMKNLITAFLICICLNASAQFKVVVYLTNKVPLDRQVNAFDFSKVTHINIAFFNPDTAGNFPMAKGKGLDLIVAKAHKNKVKVLLSLAGGSDQAQYHKLLMPENINPFIDKVMALVDQYSVDGIDVDLEGKNIDENYEAFVLGLSTRLKAKGKLLTGAVGWWTRGKISDASLEAYDFVNIMAYGASAKLHASLDYAKERLNYWKIDRKLPKEKLVLGTAFYARYDTAKTFVTIEYKDLLVKYPSAELKDSLVRSEDGMVINYSGIRKTRERTAFALKECSGIMVWQILQDARGKVSLLKAIDDEIRENKSKK
jgi:GH18 family chitinase